MPPIRIALCITELDIGGAERCLAELAVRMDRERFAPVVYCLAPPPAREEASFLPMLQAAGIEVHCLGGRTAWQFPGVVRRLTHLLKIQKPDLIQTFLFHANIVGRIAARRAGVGRVVSGVRVAERGARWHLWLDRLTRNRVDRYVCVSQAVADFSTTRLSLPPEKCEVIPNCIDLKKYPAAKPADLQSLGIPSGHRAITFVGRLTPQKGMAWLLKSALLWMAKLPDCDLLLVGDGPMRRTLEIGIRTAGVADRVHLAGWRADVPAILAASSLLVLPSAWEGMPNVVLEAMASRLPVVASDVEGVRELLGPGDKWQIVRYGDTQLLYDSIVNLMRDPTLAAAIGLVNRRRAEEHFDISRMVGRYEDLWESLVHKQHG